MAKVFWKGVISFGMVAIPVRMHVATESKTPSFHLLHKKCLTRVKQVLFCPVDNEYFSSKDTVRGYEYTKEQYLVLDESDFNKVPIKTAHAISILGFVEAKEIDPIYYYDTHYLVPEELGVKPFSLLREALLKTKRFGIAKVSFQRREHLVCLRPTDDIMLLHTMHYNDEVLPKSEFTPPKAELSAEEMEMATTLVNTMSRSFAPQSYKDEYSEALKSLIEAKLKGEKIKAPELPKVEVIDLMSALRASIETARKESAEREAVPAGASRKSK